VDGGWVSGAFLMPLQRIGRGQGKKTEYAENGTKNPPDFLLKSEIWVMKSSEILQFRLRKPISFRINIFYENHILFYHKNSILQGKCLVILYKKYGLS